RRMRLIVLDVVWLKFTPVRLRLAFASSYSSIAAPPEWFLAPSILGPWMLIQREGGLWCSSFWTDAGSCPEPEFGSGLMAYELQDFIVRLGQLPGFQLVQKVSPLLHHGLALGNEGGTVVAAAKLFV